MRPVCPPTELAAPDGPPAPSFGMSQAELAAPDGLPAQLGSARSPPSSRLAGPHTSRAASQPNPPSH